MKIGIIGLPQSGKTTLFNLLTDNMKKSSNPINTGVAQVLDPRVTHLAELFNPKKLSYAAIEIVDIAGFIFSQAKKDHQFYDALHDVDAFVQVVSTFENGTDQGQKDPMSELDQIQAELVLTDWNLVENQLEKIAKERMKSPQNAKKQALLTKCQELLEQNLPLKLLDLTDEEAKDLRGYDFFTLKPVLLVINVDEDQMNQGHYPHQDQLEAWAKERGIPLLTINGQVEMEINELNLEDRLVFLQEMGISETGIQRLAREVYAQLGLIVFFTVGEDEVKAWPIPQGATAKQGAGKIHSDIERGFIKAEVVSYDDFAAYGSLSKLKEKGLFHLESKDYVIADGDIINFRFNI